MRQELLYDWLFVFKTPEGRDQALSVNKANHHDALLRAKCGYFFLFGFWPSAPTSAELRRSYFAS